MINHARTLLLNKDGDKRPAPTYFLEEYVDPAFKAISLPAYLQNIYDVLIGSDSDNAYANYRLFQYMKLLHSTELQSYVYSLDPRVTYLREKSALSLFPDPSAVLLEGPASTVYFLGAIDTGNTRILSYNWTLEIISSYVARAINLATSRMLDTAFTVAESLSGPIALPGQSGFTVKVEDPSIGSKWLLSAFVPPGDGLPEIITRLQGLKGGSLPTLFRGPSPYDGFKKIWENYPHLQMSLSALLLAWVYKTEEVRLNG